MPNFMSKINFKNLKNVRSTLFKLKISCLVFHTIIEPYSRIDLKKFNSSYIQPWPYINTRYKV